MKKIQTGEVFGRLTVIEATTQRQHGNVVWLCRCVCGNTKAVRTKNLRVGSTKSCGCLQKEKRKEQGKKLGTAYGFLNHSKRYHRKGIRKSHRKAGGTRKVKALVRRLGL